MKLKYYLRGLGIGIFVSVLLIGLTSGRQKMTDEEVIARAKELGMVENMVLSEMNNPTAEADDTSDVPPVAEPEETTPAEIEPVETKPVELELVEIEPEETEPAETEPEETEPAETEPEETEPAETEPEETKPIETESVETESGETITITIRSGESSVTVSKTLEAAGLVKDASDYDRYLCEYGYDRRIRVGTYEIPVGATEEEIANIIAGKG